jgi:hypothetical protein
MTYLIPYEPLLHLLPRNSSCVAGRVKMILKPLQHVKDRRILMMGMLMMTLTQKA